MAERVTDIVRVRYRCGVNHVGNGKVRECPYEGEAIISAEDWQKGTGRSRCAGCGSLLLQSQGHFNEREKP